MANMIDGTGILPPRTVFGAADNLFKRFVRQKARRKDAALKHWDPNLDEHVHTALPTSRQPLEERRTISFRGWIFAAAVSVGLWTLLIFALISWF